MPGRKVRHPRLFLRVIDDFDNVFDVDQDGVLPAEIEKAVAELFWCAKVFKSLEIVAGAIDEADAKWPEGVLEVYQPGKVRKDLTGT